MKTFFLILLVSVFVYEVTYAQPKSPSSAQSGSVKVYTDNGYYVNAENFDSKAYRFSFRYETEGYTVTSAAWSKFPVYTLVSTSSDVYENVLLAGNEKRSLFTAPVAADKKAEYYIRIVEVYNVRPE